MKSLKIVFRLVVVIAVAFGAVFALGWAGIGPFAKSNISANEIKGTFRDIAELATNDYDFTATDTFSDGGFFDDSVLSFLTSKSFTVQYEGTAKAGIKDISDVGVAVNDNSHVITITAPDVEVLSVSIDTGSANVVDEDGSILNPIKVKDVHNFIAHEKARAITEAKSLGFLDKARASAEKILIDQTKKAIANTDQADYTVTVKWQ